MTAIDVSREALTRWRAARDETAASAFSPRSRLTLSEWADRKRFLSADLGEPGQWRTDRVPYMRRPMDAITDPRVREVTIIKPTRIGATQSVVLNAIGYYVDQEPSPTIVALPTIDDATKFSTQLMQPMFDDTPCLQGKLEATKSKRRRATMLQKSINGITLQIVGTKSPRALRLVHGRIILMSEIDAYELSSGTEGEPTRLLAKRAGSYGSPKLIRESTPLIKETSRIEPAYLAGSMEHFEVPCPHCGEFQVLEWGSPKVAYGIKWEPRKPETAHYVCRHCGCVIEETLKYRMVTAGKWKADHPERREHLSFHLNSLVSSFDGARWPILVKEFLETLGKPELLKVFVNTVLGESFHEDGTKVEPHLVADRHEAYTATVPAGVGVLLRTFDVQGDRLETLVVGFGQDEEMWPIEHEIIEGDPGIPEGTEGSPFNAAAEMLPRTYKHESGTMMTPTITGIDIGGHHAKNVYAFARNHRAERVWAIQGSNLGQGVPLVSKQKYSNTGKTFFFSLGVFTAKEAIVKRLEKVLQPGPGYIHIADWMDREHIEQLTGEELVSKVRGGRLTRMWKKLRDRNEFLDLVAYAFCLLHALGPGVVRNLGEAARGLMADAERAKAEAEAAALASADPDAAPPPTRSPDDERGAYGLRERRGGWMRGRS